MEINRSYYRHRAIAIDALDMGQFEIEFWPEQFILEIYKVTWCAPEGLSLWTHNFQFQINSVGGYLIQDALGCGLERRAKAVFSLESL